MMAVLAVMLSGMIEVKQDDGSAGCDVICDDCEALYKFDSHKTGLSQGNCSLLFS
jgi:hypothetical protein